MGDSVMYARTFVTAGVIAALLTSAGCRRKGAESQEHETPTLDVTSWTDKSELFMEYPPLVSGQSARFAVHLTKLQDFKALNEGKPSVTFTPEGGGAATVFAGTAPLRPGAFRVEGTPPAPGRYRWVLNVDAPSLTDKHDLGVITVFADEKAAFAEAKKQPADDPSAIAYLKEQQWTNEFATTPVREAELRTSVRVPASIEPLTGGEAMVSAPAAGRLAAASLPTIGTIVRAGQVLGRLEPRLSSNEDRAVLEGPGGAGAGRGRRGTCRAEARRRIARRARRAGTSC
jgi:cobalt-zinc-cadmium efflux system membrane fusion protein